MDLRELKGVGEKTEKLFFKLGIFSVEDLIRYYPREYEEYADPVAIKDLREGETVTVRAAVSGPVSVGNGRIPVTSVMLQDETGKLRAVWYRAEYIRSVLRKGDVYRFRGKTVMRSGVLQMEMPAYYTAKQYEKLSGSLQPRYSLTKGLSNNAVAKAVKTALDLQGEETEILDRKTLERLKLPGKRESLSGIHFPKNREEMAKARSRLAFEEFFIFLLRVRLLKANLEKNRSLFPMKAVWDTEELIRELPYRLTGAQMRTWREIEGDLTRERPMSRLIQGDVGSGKTILAFLAILQTIRNGYQASLMAPTEVLAAQHYETISAILAEHGITGVFPCLLTGRTKGKERRQILTGLKDGSLNLAIGTHALIQDTVEFASLGLAVIDEQHRFGVRQRERLAGREKPPHVLVMSATPIPRTLAIILYGDLDISLVDELPGNRLPIKNCVVGTDYRKTAYRFIEKQVREGRQAYVICPMVEASEGMDAENVTDYADELRKALPEDITLGVLHGRMRPAKKEEVMAAFAAGDLQVLVSTTVIEVGINVPNASVMMVENAERFGLAQLHQLRGRVGRGAHQSYCIFVQGETGEETSERLAVIGHSNDGFFIAGEDLRLRGPGDMFGLRQSGELAFSIADIYRDAALLQQAGREAARVLALDPDLSAPEHKALAARLRAPDPPA